MANENETDKATPRPWGLSTSECIIDVNGKAIAYVDPYYRSGNMDENEANKALIVRAVNCHDRLVEALRGVSRELNDLHAAIADQGLADRFVDDSINMISEGQTAIEQARAALDAAKK